MCSSDLRRARGSRSSAPRVKPPVPVQPLKVDHLEPTPPGPPAVPTGPVGQGPGGGGDNPIGDPDSQLTGTGACAVPPCGPPERTRHKRTSTFCPATSASSTPTAMISGSIDVADFAKRASFRPSANGGSAS